MSLTALLLALTFAQPAGGPGPNPGGADAVLLDDYGPCGLTSLFLVCQIRQVPVEWERLKELVGSPNPDGSHSFEDLARAAAAVGMHPIGLQVDRAVLNELPMPAIVQVRDPRYPERPHLLVLVRPEPDGVTLLDPPHPAYFLHESRFASTWTGNVLVFARDQGEARRIRTDARTNEWLGFVAWGAVAAAILGGLALTRRWVAGTCSRLMALVVPRRHRLAKLGFLTAACLAVGGLVTGYLYRRVYAEEYAPRCAFDSPAIELGELTPGAVKYSVTIHNRGGGPLRISRILSTCSCAAVKAPGEIEAGQSGLLEVALNVPPGPRSARLTVESNDPHGPRTVVLSWHGRGDLGMVPSTIRAQAVPVNRPYERTVRVIYPGGKAALAPRVEGCRCDSALVEVRVGNNNPLATRFARSGVLTQAQGEAELHVKVRPPDAPGAFTSKCTLSLKYGDTVRTLTLPISLSFIDQALGPVPPAVTFSAANAEGLKGQTREVHITPGKSGGDLVLRDVPPWLKGEIHRGSDGHAVIRLRVVDIPPGPLARHTLQIAHADGSRSRTSLPVTAFAPQR
jgi:hypothetical protein